MNMWINTIWTSMVIDNINWNNEKIEKNNEREQKLKEFNEMSPEEQKEHIDNLLSDLELKVNSSTPFEKNENWSYSLYFEWVKLDVELTVEELIKLYKLTLHIKNLHNKWEFNADEKFYAKEGFMSWTAWVGQKIDLYIDNRPFDFDTVYLSNEWLENILVDFSQKSVNNFMYEYSEFLNNVFKKEWYNKKED